MKTTLEIMKETAAVKTSIMTAPTEDKNRILTAMADRLVEATEDILAANALDMADAEGRLSTVMLDRLKLTEARIQGMADGIREVVKLPDPAWEVTESHTRADGLEITKTRVPL
ncbi:MAG: gamma-glutamyl-phosphate reductase, partial [Clostridia bacterium]|nr:gamma-glutamyl-phosphate reductase [Clostridia bacterium]